MKTSERSVEEIHIQSLSGYQVATDEEDYGATHDDVEKIALKLNEVIQTLQAERQKGEEVVEEFDRNFYHEHEERGLTYLRNDVVGWLRKTLEAKDQQLAEREAEVRETIDKIESSLKNSNGSKSEITGIIWTAREALSTNTPKTKKLSDLSGLEELINKCGFNLRSISWHSDGSVMAKSGAGAKHPRKIYNARTPEEAVAKLLKDNTNTPKV